MFVFIDNHFVVWTNKTKTFRDYFVSCKNESIKHIRLTLINKVRVTHAVANRRSGHSEDWFHWDLLVDDHLRRNEGGCDAFGT